MPMSEPDDPLGDDPEVDKFVEEFERHRDAIYERILDYMDEVEINEAYVAQLLIDAMIRMRMTAYGLGVESASVAGSESRGGRGGSSFFDSSHPECALEATYADVAKR